MVIYNQVPEEFKNLILPYILIELALGLIDIGIVYVVPLILIHMLLAYMEKEGIN